MGARDRMLLWLRTLVLDVAHRPNIIGTKWHDRLETIADRVISPFLYL